MYDSSASLSDEMHPRSFLRGTVPEFLKGADRLSTMLPAVSPPPPLSLSTPPRPMP
ncbi:MAG: hypothetical protein MZV63_63550 [Marinilabiliales bacterium]|nr:hypothetical protein [Marinilabiliales bacterium]